SRRRHTRSDRDWSSDMCSSDLVSTESGEYLITNLPVGDYRLVVSKPGFSRYVQKGITLVVDQNARVDIALAVGDVSESVTVTARSEERRVGRESRAGEGRGE